MAVLQTQAARRTVLTSYFPDWSTDQYFEERGALPADLSPLMAALPHVPFKRIKHWAYSTYQVVVKKAAIAVAPTAVTIRLASHA